jgi:hypothetical protein
MAKKKIPQIVKDIQSSPLREIDWSYQKLVSYSQLSMFSECEKKWSLQYREGYKAFTSNIHTIFGSAMHETIQHYLNVMYSKSGAAADKIDLVSFFEDKLRQEYATQYKKNKNKHFSDPSQINEFYQDGIKILEFFKKKRSKYFSKRKWYLVGCEIPITQIINKKLPNVIYQGYLDVVMYNELSDSFLIIDIKTSTTSWKDKDKKNENKTKQLVLYKKLFSEQFNIDINKINVEYFILKRKIYEDSEFPIPRIQQFRPASGKGKQNKALDSLNNFIEKAFDSEGYKDNDYIPTINNNCKYCPFYKSIKCSATFEG